MHPARVFCFAPWRSVRNVSAMMLGTVFLAGISAAGQHQKTQRMDAADRNLAKQMLADVADDVRKTYYDPSLHGLEWDALVKQVQSQLETAPDVATANLEIEGLLERLHDSHTFFVPPKNANSVDYGWTFASFGNKCFVSKVEKGSDADRQGVKPGDEVLLLDGFNVDRASVQRLHYTLDALMPRTAVRVYLRTPEGKVRQLDLAGKIKPPSNTPISGEFLLQDRQIEYEEYMRAFKAQRKDLGPQLMVMRVPAFVLQGSDVDSFFREARKHESLIIDLRGNAGGSEESLMRYLSDVLSDETSVADSLTRDKPHPLVSKPNRGALYTGKIVVLIDAETASAAEIFARTLQLHGRAKIVGDVSSGNTMEAEHHRFRGGAMHALYFDSVTVGELRMSNGELLEGKGVVPDTQMIPSPSDLAKGGDPVLSFAADLTGVKLTPEAAAVLIPDMPEPK